MAQTVITPDKIFIVGEIGINHNGNLELVKELICLVKDSGADCVKFQKRDIDSCYSKEELSKLRESPWGHTFRQQKEGLELGRDDYNEIDRFCQELDILWTASPWDIKSVEFLKYYDLPYIKIASPVITDKRLLKAVVNTGKPLFLSTGMCSLPKIFQIVNYLESINGNIDMIYHCTSTYPSKKEELNLLGIQTLLRNFPKYNIGFSGHEKGISSSVLAVALGAQSIERHITIDRTLYGSDQAASLEPKGFSKMVRDIRDWELSSGDGRILVYPSEEPIIKKLRRIDDFDGKNS